MRFLPVSLCSPLAPTTTTHLVEQSTQALEAMIRTNHVSQE